MPTASPVSCVDDYQPLPTVEEAAVVVKGNKGTRMVPVASKMPRDMTTLADVPTRKRARLYTADERHLPFDQWANVFDPILSRLRVNLPGKSESFCRGLCEELYRCLIVKSRARDPMELSVPPLVDMAWHEAILNTRRYMMFCDALGGYIHHTTDTVEDAQCVKNKRLQNMRDAYRLVWGAEPQNAYWAETESESEGESEGDEFIDCEADIVTERVHSNGTLRSGTSMGEDVLQIEFRDVSFHLVWMQMKYTTTMIKAMTAFARKMGTSVEAYRFHFDGHRIFENDTPRQLCMKSGDVVVCIMSLLGC